MRTTYDASITYDTDAGHPDAPNSKGLVFADTYTIEKDAFFGWDDIREYIEQDLLLVAGGGYDWKHVKNYNISIRSN